MTRKEIAKDFLLKVILPVFLAWFLFAMFKPVFTNDGVTDYFKVWLVCGIPFGIWRLRVYENNSFAYKTARSISLHSRATR